MGRINAYFVCGGKYHDFDFPRLEVLRLLNEHEPIRARVGEDFSDIEAIGDADFLISYTCDVRPTEAQEKALADFVGEHGKRWFALHATNSFIEFTGTHFKAPRIHRKYVEVLGSQFISHPPIARYPIDKAEGAEDHPLVRGLPDRFVVEDELYVSEYHGDIQPLLVTEWGGKGQEGFEEVDFDEVKKHPVLYLHQYGSGEVLYFTPGHARGRYDMQPLLEEYPHAERGAWMEQSYYEVLRRGIRWAAGMSV